MPKALLHTPPCPCHNETTAGHATHTPAKTAGAGGVSLPLRLVCLVPFALYGREAVGRIAGQTSPPLGIRQHHLAASGSLLPLRHANL